MATPSPGPRLFDVRLPDLPLRNGGVVTRHHARGSWWGPATDLAVLSANCHLLDESELHAELRVVTRGPALTAVRQPIALDDDIPTVLVVHALTGDARAAGPLGFWSPLIGPGQVFDTDRMRVICINNLGSNYGSSSPLDPGWPAHAALTTLDQAQAIWLALDALGVATLHLAAGGSLGGMIVQALAALRPTQVNRIMAIGAAAVSSPWVIGLNHVQRQAIALDPGFPHDVSRGLEIARQIATLSYRAEPGLALTQPRTPVTAHAAVPDDARWHYPIESYLEHQGAKLRRRFDGRSYLAMLDAMDSHDFTTVANDANASAPTRFASALVVDIDTDVLFTAAAVHELAVELANRGSQVTRATLQSLHGHDAFLIEWGQMQRLCAQALAQPTG